LIIISWYSIPDHSALKDRDGGGTIIGCTWIITMVLAERSRVDQTAHTSKKIFEH